VSFEYPLLLCLLPLALLPVLGEVRRRRRYALPLSLPAELQRTAAGGPGWRLRLLWLPASLVTLAVAAAVIAASGPYTAARHVTDRRAARDIALAMDASESMRAQDFRLAGAPISRMDAAVRLAGDFIALREGDRIAIVAFGGRAVTQCPLTFDREIARTLLANVEAEMLGKRTALGDGIALAVARLRDGPPTGAEKAAALVLISDGRNTAGEISPLEAARAAAARRVKVYAIGVGSEGPVPVPARLPSGRVRMEMKDYALDEATLRQIADLTGGRYFRASDADALQKVFAEIDRLEKHEVPLTRTLPARRLSAYAAAAAAVALCCALISSATFLRTVPRLK